MISISFLFTPLLNHRQYTWIEKPANNNKIAVTWDLSCELRDLRRLCPGHTKETNPKTRTNSLMQVETKDTSMGARIHNGKSSELFYPTSKFLTTLLFRVRFRVVEILLVARHEMSQINTLHALANIYDIWRRAQSLLDYWRELPLSQNPDCWESTRSKTYTLNNLKRRFRQPLCDPHTSGFLGKPKLRRFSWLRTKTLGYLARCHWSTVHPLSFYLSGNSL